MVFSFETYSVMLSRRTRVGLVAFLVTLQPRSCLRIRERKGAVAVASAELGWRDTHAIGPASKRVHNPRVPALFRDSNSNICV